VNRIRLLLTEEATGAAVEAELDFDLGPHDLSEVEEIWGPLRREAARRIAREQGPTAVPQHWHWDWRSKGSLLRHPTFRCLGIRCRNEMQGIVMVDADRHRTKLAPDAGKPLMYVEFVEIAPWNSPLFVKQRRFTPVGPRLIEATIRLSDSEGYHGRIGLHSLPQSEVFYERCGMTAMENDASKENLRYYEMTREQAKAFLEKGERP
jgi:hypothetical protein